MAIATIGSKKDVEAIKALNLDFIEAVYRGDAKRLETLFADTFIASNPDGSVKNKAEYLKKVVEPHNVVDLKANEVDVLVYGDFAIVLTHISWKVDGQERHARFTDGYARQVGGEFKCVNAHVNTYEKTDSKDWSII